MRLSDAIGQKIGNCFSPRGGSIRRLVASVSAMLVVSSFVTSAFAADQPVCKPPFKENTVTVMYQPSGLSSYFYANAAKIWHTFGLNIEQIKIEAGQAELGSLASGSVDFAFLGGPPTLTAIAKKLPVKIVFSTNNVSHLEGLVVRPSSKITNLRDLIGKTIASPKGSSAWVGMHLVLAKAGIDINKVHIVNLSPAATLAAFAKGDIDGAWIWDTWVKRLEGVGGKVVAIESDYGVAEPNTWVASDGFLKAHPDVAARFVAALNLAAEGVNKDPSVAAPQYSELTGVTMPQALEIMKVEPTFTISEALNNDSPMSFTNSNKGLAQTLQVSGNILKQNGILPNAPSSAQIARQIDLGLISQAKNLSSRCH